MRIITVVVVIALCGTLSAVAVENLGAKNIILDGGSRGEVPFPHQLHQARLEDCNVCHKLFPQKLKGIEQLKMEGKLLKKQVMNKHCVKCHRATKRAGGKTGPTTCSKCHVKKK